ncbi:hypothetical protein A0H81_03311 [Grifola frondosa]|uniref:Methyltransferase n=1 Tax=Grifola frondosa TaxID=5627 RepID=A0A1C7MHY8_GRIFR|nr:hypothetical protein A0H81_03311 [Grifola frondosa]
MTRATALSPRDVSTTLNYYAPIGDEAPYQYVYDAPEGKLRDNLGSDPQPVIVQDVRGNESAYTLDTTGFQYIKWPSEVKEFKQVGAKRVFIFDHTIRRKPNHDNDKPGAQNRGPVERVHIDQTFTASVERVRRHLGEDANRLLQSRVRIINVWRPIGHPVVHKPLAVSDWRHLDQEKDLVPRALQSKPPVVLFVKPNPEEVTLIKCYDSEIDRARLTPHSAFLDATSPAEAPQRQSIEVRALVFDTD